MIGAILGGIAGIVSPEEAKHGCCADWQLLLFFMFRKYVAAKKADGGKKLNKWDEANLLQNMKNENVHVSTVANQRYVYRECEYMTTGQMITADVLQLDSSLIPS